MLFIYDKKRRGFMPYDPTGQSFEELLGGAKVKSNQTDFYREAEQASRKRDAQIEAAAYKNATPLKKAEMKEKKAQEKFDTIRNNPPAGKNVPPEKIEKWAAQREAARQDLKAAKQEVEKLKSSPTKKATVKQVKTAVPQEKKVDNQEKTKEEKTLESLKEHLPGQIEEYSNLSNQLHSATLRYLNAQSTLKEHTTSMNEVRLPLANVTKKLEELQNKGPIKQFPLFKLFVDKQKQRDKKIGELKQEKDTLEKELRPLEAKNKKLSSAVENLKENKDSLENKLKNVGNWIKDAKREIKALNEKINPKQPEKNNSISL
jgi:chromosome segregation ATPase